MGLKYKDTFIVFETHKKRHNPFVCPRRLSDELRISHREYIAHSTRAYRSKDCVYLATEILFRSKRSSEELPVQSPCFPHHEGIGAQPPVDKATPRIIYAVYDPRQLHLESQRGTRKSRKSDFEQGVLYGEPLLKSNGKLFKFKEIKFPMTQYLYGQSCDVHEKVTWPNICPIHATLEANFILPDWFEQEEFGRVVVPLMRVSEFLGLRLFVKQPLETSHSQNKLQITRIVVELRELITYTEYDKEGIGFDPRRRVYRTNTLLDLKCKVAVRPIEGSDGEYRILSSLLDCTLPDIGPTFFTNNSQRSYGIRIGVELGFQGNCPPVTLYTFLEISVAEKIYHNVKRQAYSGLRPQWELSILRWRLTIIERFSRFGFRPEWIAKRSLREVAVDNCVTYSSHQTDALVVGTEVLVVTNIDISHRTSFDCTRNKACIEFKPAALPTRPRTINALRRTLFCEVMKMRDVFEGQSSDKLIGGLFLASSEGPVSYSFPFGFPFDSYRDFDPSVGFIEMEIENWNLKFDVLFQAKFREHKFFEQARGENIVLSGMRVPEFLILECTFPISHKEANKISNTIPDIKIRVKRVRILIKKTKMSIDCRLRLKETKNKLLWDEASAEDLLWSEFPSSQCKASKALPSYMYECSVPALNATFFSENLSQTYEIIAEIFVSTHSRTQKLVLSQEIKVASSSFEVSSAGSTPPPAYEAI